MEALVFDTLKTKQRRIRDGFSEGFGLRIHRALSWVNRAEQAGEDQDTAFIFYWIAFNAAYAKDTQDAFSNEERSIFEDYFAKVISLDPKVRLYDALWEKFSDSIRVLLDNEYVFQPFWKHQNTTEQMRLMGIFLSH